MAAAASSTVRVNTGKPYGAARYRQPALSRTDGCTACERKSLCEEVFTCATCGLTFRACHHRPLANFGKTTECEYCQDVRRLGKPHPYCVDPVGKRRTPSLGLVGRLLGA
jgi:hypothetical protein